MNSLWHTTITLGLIVALCFGTGANPSAAAEPLPADSQPTKKPQVKAKADGDEEVKGQRPRKSLGSLQATVASTKIEEGQNLDIALAIRNGTGYGVYGLSSPDTRFASMGFRIRRTDPKTEPVEDTLPDAETIRDKEPYAGGGRFSLAKDETRTFHILLLGGERHGIHWLPPGSYEVRVLYLSLQDHGKYEKFEGWEEIDWNKMLVSGPIKLTITAPKNERTEAVAAARAFLAVELDDPETFLAEYRRLLKLQLDPSLEKRVRWYAAMEIWARSVIKHAKPTDIREFEELAKLPLTAGEKERFLMRLADIFVREERYSEAKNTLKNLKDPRAEDLRKHLDFLERLRK